jgi:hypothetical protein
VRYGRHLGSTKWVICMKMHSLTRFANPNSPYLVEKQVLSAS